MDLLTTTACALPTAERPLRLAEFDALFANTVTTADVDGNRAFLRLSGTSGLADHVRDLAARESSCCSFFDFDVTGTDTDLRLAITVPPEHVDLLQSLVDRAAPAAP